MTDPNTISLTTNPQDLINQALGTTPLPTPEPLQPEAPAPEVTSPPATPQVELASEIEQTPTENVTAESVHKPSVDEMPLAFANTTQVQEPIITSAPIEPATTIPPVMTTPLPEVPKKTAGAAKTMVNLFVGLLALFGIMSGVGYYAYQTYGTINPTTIAAVQNDTEDSCNGCTCDTEGCGGGWKRWDKKTQSCKVTGICNSGKPDKDTEDPMAVDEVVGGPDNCPVGYTWCGVGISKCVSHDALAEAGGGCNKYGEVVYGIPSNYGSAAFEGTCNDDKMSSGLQTQCDCGNGTKTCFERRGICFLGGDGGETISASDYTDNPNVVSRSDGSFVNMGLCGLVSSYKPGSGITTNEKFFEMSDCYDCDNNGCSIKSNAPDKCYGASGCTVVRYECNGTVGGNSCTNTSSTYVQGSQDIQSSIGFKDKCGTVEQIDVMCGGQYIASRTQVNPECTEEEEVDNGTHKVCDTTTYQCKTVAGSGVDSCSSDADCMPTLMCSGLTQNPTTTPKIGDNILFTCTGTTVPTGAVKLSYDYRYQIDGGAWKQMATDKSTNPKGTLTVAACGSYKVQCRVCGTINGAQVCDPTWIGATQQ